MMWIGLMVLALHVAVPADEDQYLQHALFSYIVCRDFATAAEAAKDARLWMKKEWPPGETRVCTRFENYWSKYQPWSGAMLCRPQVEPDLRRVFEYDVFRPWTRGTCLRQTH